MRRCADNFQNGMNGSRLENRLASREGKMTKDLLNIKSFDRRRVLQGIAGGFAAAGTTTLFAPAVRAAR
jgi:hypothetical protein